MGRPSKLKLKYLKYTLASKETKGKSFFNRKELEKIYKEYKETHTYTSFHSFLTSALKNDFLKLSILDFPHLKYYRYFNNKPNIYEICMSLHNKAYLSHYIAVFIHGLTLNIPKTIYLNIEQTQKPKDNNDLSQLNINKAFYRKSRISNNYTHYEQYKIYLLNGKNTKGLGIIEKELLDGTVVKTTSIERTLIDIAVSPYYCGGVTEVLNVYKTAKGLFSPIKLAKTLQKLDYIYPFHQVIGFYLEKAGYDEKDLKIFEDFNIIYKFFIDRQIENKKLDQRWNLYYPDFF